MFPKKPKIKKLIYLDHAATTPVDPIVKKAMEPFYCDQFANPSGICAISRKVNGTLNDARRTVAQILGTLPDTIIFTGGGSESDNLAIFGVARKHSKQGKHIITTRLEHHAVLHPMQQLEKDGFKVTYLDVDKFGFVTPERVIKAIQPDTILISIMYANNEIGTIEPIADIGRALLKYRKEHPSSNSGQAIYPFFHSDACQAAGALDLNVEKLHVDLMTLNGSKIYGPKGVGVLFKRRDIDIQSLIFGGTQEFGMRAGTENVPGIVGIAKALELTNDVRNTKTTKLRNLTTYFWKRIQKEIPKVRLNGPEIGEKRLPNNLNISILDIEGEAILLYLDEYGITCSTGSACTSHSLEPSHVLTACGLPYEYAHGSLRFTLGKSTTKKEIDYVMKYLPEIAKKLRKISPVHLKQKI